MFERMANGWELTKESCQVLWMDKRLLILPLISGVACLLVLASFAIPLWGTRYAEMLLSDGLIPNDPLAYAILFAFYFVNYFIIVFFNSALVACALARFQGGTPTISDGLRAAGDRLPQIVGWALVAATVGLILKAVESRSERVGQIAAGLLGIAWSIATYFVVPVLVVERTGPIQAMQRSVAVIRRTWGEALTANFSIGVITFLALLPGLISVFVGIPLIFFGQSVLGGVMVAIGIVLVILISLVASAIHSILVSALYLYAIDGKVPKYFDNSLLRNAFGTTKS